MSTSTNPTRGFWPLRDLPVAVWLFLLVVATLIHRMLPVPRWLMIHLLLLGAITHAIFVWSQYFAVALTRLPARDNDRKSQNQRLLLLNAGTVVVVAGVMAAQWMITGVGAALIGAAVIWHGANLSARMRRALPSRFGTTVRYYITAAAFLPLGLILGTVLSAGQGLPDYAQTTLAHALLNVLGWVGLTVAGTLVTLWPTMLRTRIADNAARNSKTALPVLAGSTLVAAAGAVLGLIPVVVLGLAGYLAGMGILGSAFVFATRAKKPTTFATLSALAAVSWWVGTIAWLAIGIATGGTWPAADKVFATVTPYLAAGFGAQILVGALSYLVPVALGKGPGPVRAATSVLDRAAAFRVVLANASLLVCALPVPDLLRVLASVLYLIAMAWFLPLLIMALRTHGATARRLAAALAAAEPGAPRPRPVAEPERPPGQLGRQAMAALITLTLVMVLAAWS